MSILRTNLTDFALDNPLYSGATVTVYAVDPVTLLITSTLAPLYSDLTTSTSIPNPQDLDGDGKWQQPVYVDQPVIMVVSGGSLVDQEMTGIVSVGGQARGTWGPGIAYSLEDLISDGAAGNDTQSIYICASPNVSSTSFAADLAAGLWQVYIDLSALASSVTSAAEAAAAAAAAAGAAAAGTTAAEAVTASLMPKVNGAMTGATIDNSTIGATTPGQGTFTSLATHFLEVGSNSDTSPVAAFNGAAASYRQFYFQTAGSERWSFYADATPESGGNAGSNLGINSFSDTGAYLSTPISINRATGAVTLSTDPASPLGAATRRYADGSPFRNRIMNGRFNVQQRGAGPFSAGAWTADRWLNATVGDTAAVTIVALADADRAAIGDEFAEYGLQIAFTGTATAANYTAFREAIEDVRSLSGKTVTLSFWAKAAAAITLGVYALQSFGTGGSPSAPVYQPAQAIAISTAWGRYSATFTLPSAAGKTLGTNGDSYTLFGFACSSGSTNSAQFGVGVQSGAITTTGVQVEVGATASSLEYRSFDQELDRCQRYYRIGTWAVNGYAAAAPNYFGSALSLGGTMRTTPTVIAGSSSGTLVSSFSVSAVDPGTIWQSAYVASVGAFYVIGPYTASADL